MATGTHTETQKGVGYFNAISPWPNNILIINHSLCEPCNCDLLIHCRRKRRNCIFTAGMTAA